MENESEIVSALQKGVVAAVAASDQPALPVKYLLVDSDGTDDGGFTVPDDKKYLEVVWLPNNRRNDFRGDEKNHRGILRLVLHWPNQSTGIYAPLELFASITRYFTNGKLLSGVQIYGTPDPTGMIEDGDEVMFPVSIYYMSYRKGA